GFSTAGPQALHRERGVFRGPVHVERPAFHSAARFFRRRRPRFSSRRTGDPQPNRRVFHSPDRIFPQARERPPTGHARGSHRPYTIVPAVAHSRLWTPDGTPAVGRIPWPMLTCRSPMMASPRGPRVTILGTGALACALGARLARFGRAAVTLTGTWPQALEAIAGHGVVVDEANAVWSARVSAAPRSGPLGPAHFVLALVKRPQPEAGAGPAARSLLPGSHVLTLQGGLGNREVLEAAAGVGRVSQGLAYWSASLLGPGEVQVAPGRVVLGKDEPAVA